MCMQRVIERTDIDDSKIGGNASAEAAPEDGGAEASSVSGIDIVLANQLVEVTLSKKEFKTWLKVIDRFSMFCFSVCTCRTDVLILKNTLLPTNVRATS